MMADLTTEHGAAQTVMIDATYATDGFRDGLKDKERRACTSGLQPRKTPVKYDTRRDKRRPRIEIMFGRLKDWRRVAPRYDGPKIFLPATTRAARVMCWV